MTRRRVLLLVIGVGALGLVGYALATPPTSTSHRGTLVHRIHANADHIKVHTDVTTDLVAQVLTFQPGADTGWHTHDGVVLVVVEAPSGQGITFHHGCDVETFTNGQAFYESGDTPARAENTGTGTVIVHAYHIIPQGGPLRHDADPPHC